MMADVKGKTVFIPGGSSGIGLATAELLFLKGANVIIFSRDADRLSKAIDRIKQSGENPQNKVNAMQMDVSDNNKTRQVLENAVNLYGAPDILINCAGRSYPRYFEDISYEQFDETMKINLYGIWNTVSVLFPHMKQKGGHIINVSSMAGFIGIFGFTDYAASKFGIIGFSEALRSEARRYGIKVSVLCPADTDTPAFEVENRTKPPETAAISEAAKLFQPEQIAAAVLRKIDSNTFLIIPGFMPKVIYYLIRWFPGVVESIMDGIIKKVQKA